VQSVLCMSLYRAVGRAWTGRHTGNGGRRAAIHVAAIHVALGAVLAAATVCTCGSVARAGDYDDPSGQSFGTRVLRAIGLPDPDHPEYEINYGERSPLVVSPNRNLPAPIATDRPPAPNWPQDPDVKKRQAAKDEKVVPQGDRVIEEGRPLRPDELIPKGSRASTASSSGAIEPKKSGLPNFDWFKKRRIWHVHRRAAAGQPDRSAPRLPDAVAGSALRNSAGAQCLQTKDARRAHGARVIRDGPPLPLTQTNRRKAARGTPGGDEDG